MTPNTTPKPETPTHSPEPLYSCSFEDCRTECSHHAEDLYWYAYESRWVCENCWDELPAINDGEDSPKKGVTLAEYLNPAPPKPETEIPTPTWAMETMMLINKLTPDIKGKAFNPDWFQLRQTLESKERELAAVNENLGNLTSTAQLQIRDGCHLNAANFIEFLIHVNSELRTQLAEAVKDKERLDWWERHHEEVAQELYRIGWRASNDAQWEHLKLFLRRIRHATDSAIDTALKAEGRRYETA